MYDILTVDIIRQAVILRAQAREEIRDDELVVSEQTFDVLTAYFLGGESQSVDVTLFGLSLVIDDRIPEGIVHRRPRPKEAR